MDPDEAIARLRRGYESFNRGDVESMLEDLDPGIQVQERAEAPDPRHASGREAAIAAFQSLHEEFEEYRFEPREFHFEGDHVVVLCRQRARGRLSGVPVEGDIVHAFRLVDDRIADLRAFSTLEDALAALRSQAGEEAGSR